MSTPESPRLHTLIVRHARAEAPELASDDRRRALTPEGRARFAAREELMDLTGLVPGCVPPFGPPILEPANCLDEAFLENDRIAFNAGSLTCSIVMPLEPYLELARPEVFSFSKPPAH